jgi:hypothetical protein
MDEKKARLGTGAMLVHPETGVQVFIPFGAEPKRVEDA